MGEDLQPQNHYDECDDTQNRDQAGHDSGYRVRHGANLGLQRLHLLTMVKPKAINDVLVRIHAISVRSLARRVRSTASRVDVSSG